MKSEIAFLTLAVLALCSSAASSAEYMQEPYVNQELTLLTKHDLNKIAMAALRLPQKTDFETDADYATRLAPQLSKPVYGSVRLNDLLVVTTVARNERSVGDGYRWRYSPETEEVRLVYVGADTYSMHSADGQLWFSITGQHNETPAGSYVATNAYGVQAKVSRSKVTETRVLLRWVAPPGGRISEPARLPREDAQSALSIPGLVYVVRLVPPYAKRGSIVTRPSISRPLHEVNDLTELFFEVRSVRLVHAISGNSLVRIESKQSRDGQ